ncbi:MAG: TIGR00730 family Rossman fold protein [Proteobacteria bacterium]|nr:TIGR00730 family Rossman fold protein [Pseudomonadota bacterium]
MEMHFKEDNGPIEEVIKQLMKLSGGIRRPAIVREMILASLKAGQEDNGKVDLKLMNTSLKEMRFTAKVFGPYDHLKKVSVFGSARTKLNDPLYKTAYDLGAKLAEIGYMVITGGGPGIMQAVHEGAGPDHSFGVSIRLPFEQDSNPVIRGNSKNIMYKYFFNRKVAFLKESDAVVIFPGGFGTHDEAMETLALVQTGKHSPLPIILVDEPEGKYWFNWGKFIKEELLGKNYIKKSDMNLFDFTDSADKAIKIINKFYSRYHSIRQIGDCYIIRLNEPLEEEKLIDIKNRYGDILKTDGNICVSETLPEEIDEPEISNLPRIIIDFNKTDYGKLKQLIDDINY